MKLGIDYLLENPVLRAPLRGRRVALLGHPASVTGTGRHTLDALAGCPDLRLTAAFGPQHGMRGDKQDNMIESDDYVDPVLRIPVFSLYGQVRRPTPEMLQTFEVVLVDLQDIGTRIYTFITTVAYMIEAAAQAGKRRLDPGSAQPGGAADRRHHPRARLGELHWHRSPHHAARPDVGRVCSLVC